MGIVINENVKEAILSGNCKNPHELLGMHHIDGKTVICAYIPEAAEIDVISPSDGLPEKMHKHDGRGFFVLVRDEPFESNLYKFRVKNCTGHIFETYDPIPSGRQFPITTCTCSTRATTIAYTKSSARTRAK